MKFLSLKRWFGQEPPARARKSRARRRRAGAPRQWTFSPSIDVLEERRLLSAAPVSVAAPSSVTDTPAIAHVVARQIFYNNSRFDGNDPTANAADDNAVAFDKQALLPGGTGTFANYTSYSAGINGVMVDIAGLTGTPQASDFVFQVGTSNDPSTWQIAPIPWSITMRPGAGVDGSTRVTIVWPDGEIRNEWLQVMVRATPDTGLSSDDIFYFGNLAGDVGNEVGTGYGYVDALDQNAVRFNATGLSSPVSSSSLVDFNRDGLVNLSDEVVARVNSASVVSLPMIQPAASPYASVVGRYVLYNNSAYDSFDPRGNADDDGAIAPDKNALLPGQTATVANVTNFSRGLNAIVIDMSGLQEIPTINDFSFRMGSDDDLDNWISAPPPSSITIRPGAGANQSDRITMIWADNEIHNTWLEVTNKLTMTPAVPKADVFYFGNLEGDTQDDAGGFLYVDAHDENEERAGGSDAASIVMPQDANKDQYIDAADQNVSRYNSGQTLKLIAPYTPLAEIPPKPVETVFTDFVRAAVVNRQLFYNDSQFDGNDPAANAADDHSIATDKSALLPGATATSANYTNYSRGINGVMIDISGLPGTPTADDFEFKVGDSADVNTWTDAPAPLSISVRIGAGVGGSARISLVWPDGIISNNWLQVTVKATPNTGLKSADVFYFGNAVGTTDSGSPSGPQHGALPTNFVPITSVPLTSTFDFDRNAIIDSTDQLIAERSSNSPLVLLTAPAIPPTATLDRAPLELVHAGDGGYNFVFAPTIVKANDGTLLMIAEARAQDLDSSSYALILRTSKDAGVSWSPLSAIVQIQRGTGDYIGNPAPVVDQVTGEIFLLFTKNNDTVFVTSSRDDGKTWSTPSEITSSVKVTAASDDPNHVNDSPPWGWYATGPGHGIQIQDGAYAGRLIIACDHRFTADNSGPSFSHIIYSDDHGLTWHLGGSLNEADIDNAGSNESSVVEQSDGGLYMSIRANLSMVRGYSRSYDGGMTWSNMELDPSLTTTPVQASLLRVDNSTILLSGPDSNGSRSKMVLWVTYDDGLSWEKLNPVFYGNGGYSDMVLVAPGTVLLAYGRGRNGTNASESIGLARFNIDSLRGLPVNTPQFEWDFNEQAPGTPADLDGFSILDSSPWDNRAKAIANSPAEAPQYIAGINGDSALRLTSGSDQVQLTGPYLHTMQLGPSDSLTLELTMRTTASDGVIIGTQPDVRNWTLQMVGGFLKFSTFDLQTTSTIQSPIKINDGNWHVVSLVRDANSHLLRMYIDHVEVTPAVTDTTGDLYYAQAIVTLGSYADGSGQLALDVDTVRVTKGVLQPAQFLPIDLPPSWHLPPVTYPSDAPNSLANLKFWLPSYDPTRYFPDAGGVDPLPRLEVDGTAARSAIDASDSHFQVVMPPEREALAYHDPVVGFSWDHQASSTMSSAWIVKDSNGTSANNFDFVQNTGVFTLSTFVKIDSPINGYTSLFDTADATLGNNGFTLRVFDTGQVNLSIYGGSQGFIVDAATPKGVMALGTWYHIAAVGNGAGKPVTLYVTPVTSDTVAAFTSSHNIVAPSSNYATDANHNLTIGALVDGRDGVDGQMIDEAIYDRALSAAEIQQLFDYTKKT